MKLLAKQIRTNHYLLIISIIISFFFTQKIYGQVTYQKIYKNGVGGFGGVKKIDLTKNNGLIIAGKGLLKTDSLGDFIWAKSFAEFEDVVSLPTGDIVAIERVYNDTNIVLMKFNANGDSLWSKIYVDTLLNRKSSATSLTYTSDNGLIVAGTITDSTTNDVYVIKTDSNGEVIWSKIINVGVGINGVAGSVKQLSDGNYIVLGGSGTSIYDTKIILMKLSQNGNLLWTRQYGGTLSESARDVAPTLDGGFVITGTTESYAVAGQADVLFIKTDTVGKVLFSKTYGSTLVDEGYIIKQTADRGFVIAARMQSTGGGGGNCGALGPCYDYFLIKTDVNGDTLWTKLYGSDGLDFPFGLAITSDKGYLVVGTSGPNNFSSSGGTYIVKTDSLGNSPCNTYNPKNIIVGSPTIVATNVTAQVDSAGTAFSTSIAINDLIINPAKDSLLCISIPLGINEEFNNSQHIVIYPNPGSYELNISANISSGTMLLYTIVGKLVQTSPITSNKTLISTTNLSKGTYIYTIIDRNKKTVTHGKWIKE